MIYALLPCRTYQNVFGQICILLQCLIGNDNIDVMLSCALRFDCRLCFVTLSDWNIANENVLYFVQILKPYTSDDEPDDDDDELCATTAATINHMATTNCFLPAIFSVCISCIRECV